MFCPGSDLASATAQAGGPGLGPPGPAGRAGALEGGTARLLILPWPSSAREPQAEDPAQSLSPRGSPGPPDLDDSPAKEPDPDPGRNCYNIDRKTMYNIVQY